MKKLYCLFMLLVLAGCSDKPVEPLVFGAITWPGYEPAYVARELGYQDQDRIHLAEFTNTTEVVRAADAEAYKGQMQNLVKAWIRALHLIQSDSARAYPLLAQREHAQVAEIDETMRGLVLLDQRQNLLQLYGDPAPLLNTAIEIQRVLKQAGLAAGRDDMSLLINSRIVAEADLD